MKPKIKLFFALFTTALILFLVNPSIFAGRTQVEIAPNTYLVLSLAIYGNNWAVVGGRPSQCTFYVHLYNMTVSNYVTRVSYYSGEAVTLMFDDITLTTHTVTDIYNPRISPTWPSTVTVPNTVTCGTHYVKSIYKFNDSLTITARAPFLVVWQSRARWINTISSARLHTEGTLTFKLEQYNPINNQWEPLGNVACEVVVYDPDRIRNTWSVRVGENGIGTVRIPFNKVGTYRVFIHFHGINGPYVHLPRYPYLPANPLSCSINVAANPTTSITPSATPSIPPVTMTNNTWENLINRIESELTHRCPCRCKFCSIRRI